MIRLALGEGAPGHENENVVKRISSWRVGFRGLQVLVDLDIVGEPNGGRGKQDH